MNSFLNKLSVTTSQWRVLDAITRTLRAQPDLELTELPCLTFKDVEYRSEPVDKDDPEPLYRYVTTRSVGKGHFYVRGVGKFILVVSCEQTYAEYLPSTSESAYLHKLYIGFRTTDYSRKRYFKLDDLDGLPIKVENLAGEIPPELKQIPPKQE